MLTKRAADIAVATILLAIGIAQFTGGLTMDRLENRHIHPASFPGLVPMVLGAVMAAMALLLLIGQMRAGPAPQGKAEGEGGDFTRDELMRLAAVGGLCLFYALVLVGNVHFWLASSLFIAVFTALFEPAGPMTPQRRLLRLGFIAVFATAMGGGIAMLFEQAFLVRLP